jgi:hypothetical protein
MFQTGEIVVQVCQEEVAVGAIQASGNLVESKQSDSGSDYRR